MDINNKIQEFFNFFHSLSQREQQYLYWNQVRQFERYNNLESLKEEVVQKSIDYEDEFLNMNQVKYIELHFNDIVVLVSFPQIEFENDSIDIFAFLEPNKSSMYCYCDFYMHDFKDNEYEGYINALLSCNIGNLE